MFYYFAGNNFKHALNVGKNYINKCQKPIINYAIESTNSSLLVKKEYVNLISNIPNNEYSIALKLSSINFNINILNDIINKCKLNNIKLFIDAEDEKNNDKYNEISSNIICNNNSNLIYKTYQMYRKDSLNILCSDLELCRKNNITLNAKLVRGAYWNNEHKYGKLFIKKEDTDISYNQGIIELYNTKNTKSKKPNVLLATHNKYSIELGKTLNISNNIFEFAHLQGMNEKYYNTLSNTEKVYVYVPYGPYNEMIPYMIRRLYENMDMIKYLF